jgi:hypothetical protein
MIIIATRIILVLVGIGALISMFFLGRWVKYRSHLESNKLTDEVYNRCLQLDRENKYINKFDINGHLKVVTGNDYRYN